MELHGLVAADAGNGRLAAQVGVGEILDHLLAEAAFIVEHVVGDAHGVGGRARIMDVLAGAAGALLLDGLAVVVELQGDAHHLIAGPSQEGGGHGGVDAARHGRNDARANGQAHRLAGGLKHAVRERCVHVGARGRARQAAGQAHGPLCSALPPS